MKKFLLAIGLFIAGCLFNSSAAALNYPAASEALVYYLAQDRAFEAVSDSAFNTFRQALEAAKAARARALILELDTPGGNVETAFKYLSLMERSRIPVIVFLNPNGISAGMIIAAGADAIAISPNGLIGDAMPIAMGLGGSRPVTEKPADKVDPDSGKNVPQVGDTPQKSPAAEPSPILEKVLEELQSLKRGNAGSNAENERLADEKFLSVFFKMLEVLAQKNNRPVRVLRAMADPYTALEQERDGIKHDKSSPLTLSAGEAKKLNVVDFIAADRHDLLRQLGLQECKVVEFKRSLMEEIGSFLAYPAIAGILLVVGLLGIFVEVKSPGFGVPGILGLAALTLFFLGHMASGASDWGPIVIFFVGLLLLALEIFVIPGFGLIGILGIGCILISFFAAFGWENINLAAQVITLSLTAAVVLMVLLAVYVLPRSSVFRWTALNTSMRSEEGFKAGEAAAELVGLEGVTVTPLRPSGVVSIGSQRHDAASDGDFIEAGETVEVISRNGFQLVVRRKNV